jgi:hypothetical protein
MRKKATKTMGEGWPERGFPRSEMAVATAVKYDNYRETEKDLDQERWRRK